MKTSEKIRQLRIEKGLSQEALGEIVGVKKAAINKYETGRVINIKKSMLVKLAEALGVLPATLLDDVEGRQAVPSNLSVAAARPVPILGTICAGNGRICEQDFDGYFFIDSSVKADYCLHVEGDSMIDAEIYDGDIAFILADYDFQDGKIYAVIYGIEEKASLKKLYREDGHWILMPCNTEYKPIIADPNDVCVIGECIGVYRGV